MTSPSNTDAFPQAGAAQSDAAQTGVPEGMERNTGRCAVVQGVQRLVGIALVFASLGIWFAPGASWDSGVMLFKLGLSLAAGIAGLGLVQASGTNVDAREIEIDTRRREVRVLHTDCDGITRVMQRCSFAQMSRAECSGNTVRMYGAGHRLLVELTLEDRFAHRSLMAALGDAGKLG